MEFNEFREKVKEALPDFLTDDLRNAEIKDTAVNKLQGESYSGISVTPEGSRVGVSINLEDAFLDYQTGSQFTAVMNRLADTLVGTLGEREQFDLGFLADYSAVKDMLTIEVIGKDQNAEMLQSVPHQEIEDLATVYRIDLGVTENGNATVLITNEMLSNYGLTSDQLHKDALDAAQHTMKYSIRSMDEVLMGMAQSMGVEQDQPVMFSSPLYVATTERDMFGAGVLAVPSFFEDAAEKLDGNFYVLPSSVHEILLLPDRFAPEPQLLKEMVQDVNANEVDPKDRLSDNVYHYDAKERIFELAEKYERRMEEKSKDKKQERHSVLSELGNKQKECSGFEKKNGTYTEKDRDGDLRKERGMAYGQYTEDKPKDCRHCYFWGRKKKRCMLDGCYYQRKPENVNSECFGCPYGRAQPCIGWCTRKILRSK